MTLGMCSLQQNQLLGWAGSTGGARGLRTLPHPGEGVSVTPFYLVPVSFLLSLGCLPPGTAFDLPRA